MSAAATTDRFPTQLVIQGELRDAASAATFTVVNPATEEAIAHVAEGDASDVDRAVHAARATFESDAWREMSARRRGELLYRLGELCTEHKDELARLETLNNGKPVFEALIDLKLMAEAFRYYRRWADKGHGEAIPVDGPFLNFT